MTDAGTLTWQVGDVTVTRVEESIVPVARDGDDLVIGITDDLLAAQRDWVEPFFSRSGAYLLLSVHSFVVTDGSTTIVVDTCVGTQREQPMPGDPEFLDRLANAIDGGLSGVDVALCTHLHFDHVGWNTRIVDGRRVPTFPNARYLVSEDELAAVARRDEHGVSEYAIDPLRASDRLDAVATDHGLSPSVRLVATPGHTPGHVSVLIESHDCTALITGDLVHTPIQFTHPELPSAPDHDRDLATTTRRSVVERFAETDTLILGTHFPPPTGGHLRTVGGAARFVT